MVHRFKSYFPCGGCSPDGKLVLMDLQSFCTANGISRAQAMRLFRKQVFVGRKTKGRIYAAWNPSIPSELQDARLYVRQLRRNV
jgi:hypothetical protein